MKLLVVLSIKEYLEQVSDILQKAGVKRFSTIDIVGYKHKQEQVSWFASNANRPKTNSVMLFSFTTEDITAKVIADIDSCNIETKNPFPVHAFILDVDQFSKLM